MIYKGFHIYFGKDSKNLYGYMAESISGAECSRAYANEAQVQKAIDFGNIDLLSNKKDVENKICIGDYVFDSGCGLEGFVIGLMEDGKNAIIQYLTSNGPEENIAPLRELERRDRPSGYFNVEEACRTCGYLHHANNCTIRPGEYCKRYHRLEAMRA